MFVRSIVEKSVFSGVLAAPYFFDLERNCFGLFGKKVINRFVRSVFCMSAGSFQEYQFSWEAFYLLISFGFSAMFFRTFARNTSAKFAKAAFNVWAEKVRKEPFIFGKITTFFFFGILSIVFPWGFQNCLLRVQRKL